MALGWTPGPSGPLRCKLGRPRLIENYRLFHAHAVHSLLISRPEDGTVFPGTGIVAGASQAEPPIDYKAIKEPGSSLIETVSPYPEKDSEKPAENVDNSEPAFQIGPGKIRAPKAFPGSSLSRNTCEITRKPGLGPFGNGGHGVELPAMGESQMALSASMGCYGCKRTERPSGRRPRVSHSGIGTGPERTAFPLP